MGDEKNYSPQKINALVLGKLEESLSQPLSEIKEEGRSHKKSCSKLKKRKRQAYRQKGEHIRV